MLDTSVGGIVASEALGSGDRGKHETTRPELEFTLLPIHGDMFSCLLRTENIFFKSVPGVIRSGDYA